MARGSARGGSRLGGLLLGLSLGLGAACGPTHVDPGAAGPDFDVQGEYAGPKLGAQVIALGDGRFAAAFLAGGLPGSGWDGRSRVTVPGARSEGATLFRGRYEATLRGVELRGFTDAGEPFALRRTLRQSSTLGAEPPPGARVLFDGDGTGGFTGERGTEGFLRAGAETRRGFRDFRLHLEFRTPFMPEHRGQGRGRSGVTLQGRYEIQILDSFGLSGEDDECGALYALRPPDVNMAFPPLSWQTYDVVFDAARFDAAGRKTRNATLTLRHNGVVVHERVALERSTAGGDPEGPGPGPIRLEDRGSPVVFRNVWIVERGDPGPPTR